MLESGNAAVFTAGVSARVLCVCASTLALKLLMMCLSRDKAVKAVGYTQNASYQQVKN